MLVCSTCKRYSRGEECFFCGAKATDLLPREPGFARGKTRAALVLGAAALAATSGSACLVMVYGAPPDEQDASVMDASDGDAPEVSDDAKEDHAMSVDAAYGGPPIDSGVD